MEEAADGAREALDRGIAAMDVGRYAEALEQFEKASALRPSARTFNNSGIALLALERRDDAARAFERALALDPRYALASYNLARIHFNSDPDRSFAHVQASVQADASNADAWLLLADLLRRRKDYANAMRAMNVAIERSPQRASGWVARASLLAEMDEEERARGEFVAAWSRFPGDLRSALGACLTLPHVYASKAHLEESRGAYSTGLERLNESADRLVLRDVESMLIESRWTNFYLAYQGRDDRALQRRYGEFQHRLLERAAPDLLAPRKRASRTRPRVGFLSHYFYNCVVGRYFASWITRLDSSRFEKFVYYTNPWVGDDTRATASAADTFRHVAGRPLAAIARQVIADELDILVYPEVGMHPDICSFAAMRLAPVQCMAWGHPTTSGSPEMDWYLSCEAMEPEGAQGHYSERLALLPGLGTRYERPVLEGNPSRAEFGLPEEGTLYLAPQSLFKMHPDNDALIARVLAQDRCGFVVMFESRHANSTRTFRARLDEALKAAGVQPDRVRMLRPDLPHAAYMRLNAVCDVMLDSLHWSGGNTSIDAIAAGLPIITLPGALMRGRQSAAMLEATGLAELVVANPDAYVAKAVELGTDHERRAAISRELAEHRDVIFGRDEPVRALESFLDRVARES
jgi:CRISPR-associated protein Csy1